MRSLIRIGMTHLFQSTPLMRGETIPGLAAIYFKEFQSTPLMRGETVLALDDLLHIAISIHSPHARGDL